MSVASLAQQASSLNWRAHLIVLLGGEAGLRSGEMWTLTWTTCASSNASSASRVESGAVWLIERRIGVGCGAQGRICCGTRSVPISRWTAFQRTIQELAGHRSLSTTLRYMHLSPSAIADGIRALDDRKQAREGGEMVETPAGVSGDING